MSRRSTKQRRAAVRRRLCYALMLPPRRLLAPAAFEALLPNLWAWLKAADELGTAP